MAFAYSYVLVFPKIASWCSVLYLAVLLQQIIEVNNSVRQALKTGLAISQVMEHWDFLQV